MTLETLLARFKITKTHVPLPAKTPKDEAPKAKPKVTREPKVEIVMEGEIHRATDNDNDVYRHVNGCIFRCDKYTSITGTAVYDNKNKDKFVLTLVSPDGSIIKDIPIKAGDHPDLTSFVGFV